MGLPEFKGFEVCRAKDGLGRTLGPIAGSKGLNAYLGLSRVLGNVFYRNIGLLSGFYGEIVHWWHPRAFESGSLWTFGEIRIMSI